MSDEHDRQLADAVREACIRAWREGYEEAGMSGLCAEGALEAALSAVQRLDIDAVVEAACGPANDDNEG